MTREEAIRILASSCISGSKQTEALETLIPELVESEDERIRRTLVEYFGPQAQLDFIRGVPIKKIRYWLEKQKEQKPAEWSEEDEDNLCRVIRVLEDNDSDWKELSNWLKSLRPSWKPSDVCYGIKGEPDPAGVWKPSEEQMNALYDILHPADTVNRLALESLYEQLKAL